MIKVNVNAKIRSSIHKKCIKLSLYIECDYLYLVTSVDYLFGGVITTVILTTSYKWYSCFIWDLNTIILRILIRLQIVD